MADVDGFGPSTC